MYSATNFSYGEDVADGELDDEDGDELGDAAEDDMIQVRFRFSLKGSCGSSVSALLCARAGLCTASTS